MSFEASVYRAVMQVPRGRVTSYGLIAQAVGRPGSSRAVGNALGRNRDLDAVPCYRVVRSDGSVGGYAGGMQEKMRRLRADGIAIKGGRIDGFENLLFAPEKVTGP